MSVSKIRIALFGSFYRGYSLLSESLHGLLNAHFMAVGVAAYRATIAVRTLMRADRRQAITLRTVSFADLAAVLLVAAVCAQPVQPKII